MEIDVVTPLVFNVAASVNNYAIRQVNGATVLIVPTPGPPGATGPRGASGTGAQVFGETPTGTQDGSNATFTLTHTFQPASTCVCRNGLREHLSVGYTESSPQIVFTTPPLSSDVITVDYLIA